MGTDKRERQRAGRMARSEAEVAAARRRRTRQTAVRVVVGVAVVLLLLFGYSALTGGDDDSSDEAATSDTTATTGPTTTVTYSNPELADEVLAREAPEVEPPPDDTAPDALEVTTLVEGEGEGAAAGDTVTVRYVGKVPDGTVFDSSFDEPTDAPVPVANLGQAQIIAGWNEGLIGAKVGERRRLVIGSDKAYGATGREPLIPPDTPLAFEIDIVDVTPGAAG